MQTNPQISKPEFLHREYHEIARTGISATSENLLTVAEAASVAELRAQGFTVSHVLVFRKLVIYKGDSEVSRELEPLLIEVSA